MSETKFYQLWRELKWLEQGGFAFSFPFIQWVFGYCRYVAIPPKIHTGCSEYKIKIQGDYWKVLDVNSASVENYSQFGISLAW